MGLFGGDSKSKSKTTVSTTTTQIDRRVAGAGRAQVATEGARIANRTSVRVQSADANVVRAALAGSSQNFREALSFSQRQADRSAGLVEAALAQQSGGLAAAIGTLPSGTIWALAAAGGVVLLLVRR